MSKRYIKVYFNALNLPLHPDTFVPSELSGDRAVDIHHITNRTNRIENLMALTRKEHEYYGDKRKYMVLLLTQHRSFLRKHDIDFDEEWFNERIEKYKNIS